MGTVRQPGSGCGVRGRPSLRMRAFLGGLLPTFGAAQLTRGDALGAQTRCAARRCPLRPAAPPHGAHRLCSPPKATFQGCSPTSPRITLTVGGGTSARRVSAGHRGRGGAGRAGRRGARLSLVFPVPVGWLPLKLVSYLFLYIHALRCGFLFVFVFLHLRTGDAPLLQSAVLFYTSRGRQSVQSEGFLPPGGTSSSSAGR